jgi:protein-S-isoprenylcysteine O-methyltransferase Ste14
MTRASKALDYLVLVLAIFLGIGSIALFAWENRPAFVPTHLPPAAALAWDAGLSLLFFAQHSGMVRRSFRARLVAVVPSRYQGAVYTIASGVVLALVAVLWQPTGQKLIVLHGVLRWLTVAGSLFAAVVFLAAGYALRPFDMLGIRPIWLHLRGRVPRPMPFAVRGPYRWVRHPLYSCVLLLFWSCPEVTSDRLLLNVLWTAWICVGAVLEERDLVADFGDRYRDYQRRVPILVPWRGRVTFEVESGGT